MRSVRRSDRLWPPRTIVPFTNLSAAGVTTSIVFDYKHPSYIDMSNPDAGAFDPADIRELGLQIDAGGTSTTAMPAVVLIDSVCY